MRLRRWQWPALLTAGLAACQSPAAQPEADAILIQTDAASQADLQRAVASMLNVPDVLLADDALTRTSVFSIDRRAAYDDRGLRINGREMQKPETFNLFTRDGLCILVRARDQRRVILEQSHCRPLLSVPSF